MAEAEVESQEREVVIGVRNLRYAYKQRVALDNATFTVHSRSIHGFVGPNGAGKTTTLKILATLLKPQSGTAHVFGHDIVRHYKRVRRKIGFMPDTLSMYRQMTVFEYLDFFAAAYGLSLAERDRTIKDVLALTDMEGRSNDLIKSLSKGMQQRISLARTLVHDPDLLLLDEPAAGLDPRARIELMEILRELRRMGKTIFISSHILAELATLCDSVTIIDRGQIKFTGSMDDLLVQSGETATYILRLASEHRPTAEALAKTHGVLSVDKLADEPAYQITFRTDELDTNTILQVALATEGQVASFQRDTKQLDQAFLDLTEPGVPT